MKKIHFRLSISLTEKLENYAKKEGITKSEAIRRILFNFLNLK
jgi:predicted DNA-binding protein